MEFHKRLKECRQSSGLTQKQMAEILKITERQYQRYEGADAEPKLSTLRDISIILKVSTDFLLSLK